MMQATPTMATSQLARTSPGVSHPLVGWLGSQAAVHETACWVELRHIAVNDQFSAVQRWRISDDHNDMVGEIWTTAQSWTDTVGGGSQRFAVALLDAELQVLAQHMQRVGGDSVGGRAWDSEPASLEGVTKQLMRHNEVNAKLAAGCMESMVERLLAENERLSARVESHEARHLETLLNLEQLVSGKAQRDLDQAEAKRSGERKDMVLGKLAMLIPIAVSKVMGAPAPDPVVKAFAQSIDGDAMRAMASVLAPEQQLALATVLQLHSNAVDDREPDPSPPPPTQPAPEATAHA